MSDRLRVVILTAAEIIRLFARFDQGKHSTHGAVLKQLFRHSYWVTSSIALIILKDILLDRVRFFVLFLCSCGGAQD